MRRLRILASVGEAAKWVDSTFPPWARIFDASLAPYWHSISVWVVVAVEVAAEVGLSVLDLLLSSDALAVVHAAQQPLLKLSNSRPSIRQRAA